MSSKDKPLVVQSDSSLLLDVHHPSFSEARIEISAYAELEKSPEHIHTYRLSSLSLWNAAGSGWKGMGIMNSLERWSRYEIPPNVENQIQDVLERWGKVRLLSEESNKENSESSLILEVDDKSITEELCARKALAKWMVPHGENFMIPLIHRGTVKVELAKLGFPVEDMAPLSNGDPLDITMNTHCRDNAPFIIRDYQQQAVKSFTGLGERGTGFGTVVMPCGSGKTVVGIAIMAHFRCKTLILTTNVAAVHQWRNELLDKTNLKEEDIAEYTGESKNTAPVTVATYQVLTWRKGKNGPYPHFDLFRKHAWGLIIFDEVHLLPAPVFRVTAEIQAVRRLGLTATLIREDGAERDVFSLVGPKRYDIPWKELEAAGWIAEARCQEIRVRLPKEDRIPYAMADKRRKMRLAAENSCKIDIAIQLVANRSEDQVLIIGHFIPQLEEISRRMQVPIITGKTPNAEREKIYDAFKKGQERVIVVSKVANFAIDLPNASVAIQLSGTFGSRQEEAQRLGRILRPKKRNSWFYSLVSRNTIEEDYAMNRRRFLIEQGYKYNIDIWEEP